MLMWKTQPRNLVMKYGSSPLQRARTLRKEHYAFCPVVHEDASAKKQGFSHGEG
jgi:hypothetical protein